MEKLSKLLMIIAFAVVGFAVFAAVIFLTIKAHKKVESKFKNEEKAVLNILISPRDLFNFLLALPFFLFFLIAPFNLETEWTGIFILNFLAYFALVIINGAFFLLMTVKGYIGLIWGLLFGALSVALLGEVAGFAFR